MPRIPQTALLITCALYTLQCRTILERGTERATNVEEQTAPQQKPPLAEKPVDVEEQTDPEDRIDEEIPTDALYETTTDKKGKKIKTYFYGDELIREKIEIDGAAATRITIRGNALILHDDVRISAPRLVVDAGVRGRLLGGVRISDKKSGLTIRASTALYDRLKQQVELSGRPRIQIKNKGQPTTLITARRAIRDLAGRRTILEGDVRIFHDDLVLLGERGVYEDDTDKITLSKNPVILGPGQYFTGEALVYSTIAKKLLLGDQAIAVTAGQNAPVLLAVEPEKKPSLEQFARQGGVVAGEPQANQSKAEKEAPSVLSADAIEYDFFQEDNAEAVVTGNVHYSREQLNIHAPVLRLRGKTAHVLDGPQGVKIIDGGTRVTAGSMHYEQKTGILLLKDAPQMEFLDEENSEVTATLSATLLERNFERGTTLFRGDVSIQNESYRAVGELATYTESEEALLIEGSPAMEGEGGRMECERILIYPRTNRILLYNGLNGYALE